ncbi:hypothetical protein Bca4012_103292 [Brassica carinata]
MKNVAKCDTWCELQNPVNHRVFERKLRPKPSGRGHVCLGVTNRRPPILSRIWDGSWSPCVTARGWPKSELRAPGASRHAVVNSSLVISSVVPVQKLSMTQSPQRDPRSVLSDGPGPSSLERGAREGESPSCPDPVAPRGAVYESGCLGMQPQSGGKFRPRLNMGERPIANKYREVKMKRTLKRESKSA